MSTTTTASSEEESLQDVMYRIEQSTNDDGTVDAKILDVRYEKETVYFDVSPPFGEIQTFEYEIPPRATADEPLIEFLDSYGFPRADPSMVEGEYVKLERNEARRHGWEMHIPRSRRGTCKEWYRRKADAIDDHFEDGLAEDMLIALSLVTWPLAGILLWLADKSRSSTTIAPISFDEYLLLWGVWIAAILVLMGIGMIFIMAFGIDPPG